MNAICRAALALTLLAACAPGKTAPAAPPPANVVVATVARVDLPLYLEAVASLDGYVNADIRARVKGYLRAQSFKDGAFVREGQPLFSIEATEYQAALEAAKANLSRAKVAQSHAKIQLDRDQSLSKTGTLAQQDLDNAAAAADDAAAQVALADAQMRQAALNLSYTHINSPIAGVAGIAMVRVGNLVGQDGPTLLTTVSQLNPLRIDFAISESDYVRQQDLFKHLDGRDLAWAKKQFVKLDAGGNAEGGDRGIELSLSDGGIYPHRGLIVSVNRQIDPTTGTLSIQALVPNPDNLLRPGQFGRVRIRREGEGRGVVVVPDKALISVQGSYSVGVVGEGNKVSLRPVVLGASAQGMRIIEKGLSEGEKIVVEGVQKIADGAVVNPQAAPPPVAAKVNEARTVPEHPPTVAKKQGKQE